MNFIAFPVGATNIFPLANSSAGGQLMSEFNIRSRESVATDSTVKYFIGPSYTHSMEDFAVYSQKDGYDTTISNTSIQIQPGRALVNGHYVELLSPIIIDLDDANYLANKENITALKGDLAVGLRMAYSTYQTLAGSALVENKDDYYEGIQVVVVPKEAVKLPKDVPGITQFPQVNMHLLLGTFTYKNGVVSKITQNSSKIQNVEAERIGNIDSLLSDKYVGKDNLDPNKLYVFSGKSDDGTTVDGRDTWCDATDSLMIWDNHPSISTVLPSNQAYFKYNSSSGETSLVVPHKQVDGMKNTGGQLVYFDDKELKIPSADYTAGTGGVVTPAYTKKIKNISEKLDLFYRLPNGRMRQYIPILTDREDLPEIPVSRDSKWPYAASEFSLDIRSLQSAISSLDARITSIEDGLESRIQERTSAYSSEYIAANVTPQFTSIQKSISDIHNDISAIQSVLNSIGTGTDDSTEQAIALLNTRVTSVENEIRGEGGLTDKITELERRMGSYEQTLADTVHTTVIAEVDSRYSSFETTMTEIANQELNSIREEATRLFSQIQETLDAHSVFTTWTWMPGDYVLVGEDQTVAANVDGRYPSTMYIVGPSNVLSIKYVDTIVEHISIADGLTSATYQRAYQTMLREVPQSLAGGVELDSRQISAASDANIHLWDPLSSYRGAPGIDYFVARMVETDEATSTETWTCYYYTPTLTENRFDYLDPVWITGGVPLATESSIGGFINVPGDAYGGGYVRMNDDGFLQLVDYELLLTGVLAYQLGQNYSEGAGLSIEEIQSILEENVNDRVAFPNAYHSEEADRLGVDPNVIHLYLSLPETPGTLTIHDIGSRYGTSLYVHISGSATSETIVNFVNCDKLRIDHTISGAPTINLSRCHLFYDAEVLDRLNSISNLTLWYERYESTDPDLQVDGMTVTLLGKMESTDSIDPWDSTYANDNHYSYSLRSLTFGSDGSVIGIGMLVGDSTTSNIDEGKSVFASEFILPQSVGIGYPPSKMTHRIKVTGSFVSHYYVANEGAYMMKHTEFSAITQKYDRLTASNEVGGTISFYTDAQLVSAINGVDVTTTVDGWDLNTPHYFLGGIIE